VRRAEILAAVTVIVAIAAQQLFTVPGPTRLAIGLNDSAHGIWFALVLLALLFGVSRRRSLGVRMELWIGAVAALVLAPGTELLQKLTGRDAEVDDALLDLVGAVGALAIWAAYRGRFSIRVGAAIAIIAFVASFYPFGRALTIDLYRAALAPRLIDFGSTRYRWFVETSSEVEQAAAPEAWQEERGRKVLKLTLDDQRYPGLALREPIPDWTAHRILVVNVYVPDSKPMPFTVAARFWSNRAIPAVWPYVLGPGANTLRVPLDARFDPARIVSTLVLHADRSAAGRTLYLGDIHLE
jgi:hypothetical protein